MLKKLFIGLIVVIALIIGGISAYISTIDWNQHKEKIASRFENITGKKIVFAGDVSLSLFPSPYLSAKDIKIYNSATDTAHPLAVIQEMITDLSLVPLLQGKFVVDNMSLRNPNILMEFDENGKFNWESEINDPDSASFDNVDIAFNSVVLKDASVQIINPGLNLDMTLQNLNADITAQSLRGPYRVDGNFVKNNNPAGFALTFGTLSESFATSLNLVLTHPSSESYARFDGSMLPSNNEIKGNFIVEAKKPSDFINELSGQNILPSDFNYPLAFSIEVSTNKQQIDLSSFILKYGDNTAGAGNVLIPLAPQDGNDKPKIELGFEMTDLDLEPIVAVIKGQLKKYQNMQNKFAPAFDFDLIADVKAVRCLYNNQFAQDFNLQADLINNSLTIKNLSAILPGNTDFRTEGSVFENEKNLSYDFKVKTMSQDFLKLLNWLKIEIKPYSDMAYRNALIDFGLSGNLKQIKVSPLVVNLDKISAEGVVGIINDSRTKLFVIAESESADLDNYLPPISDDEKQLAVDDKIKLMLNKFKFLNDYDVHFEGKFGWLIYNKLKFENVELNLDSENSIVKINNLNIGQAAASDLNLSGQLSGLGVSPTFNNIKYTFNSSDFAEFRKVFGVPVPQMPLITQAKKIKSKGIFTGNMNDINIKTVTNLDRFNSVYAGKIFSYQNKPNFKGKLKFKTSDFTRFVQQTGFNYNPKNMPANIFTFLGDVQGSADNWKATGIDAFVGTDNFKGDIAVNSAAERSVITADITANKFEFDRFFYNPTGTGSKISKPIIAANNSSFFAKPELETAEINYGWLKGFDLNGKFKIGTLSYNTQSVKNFDTALSLHNGNIKAERFSFNQNGGEISGAFEIDTSKTPVIKGSADFKNFSITNAGGSKYAFIGGDLRAKAEFEAPATSVAEAFNQLNAKISVDVDNAVFKGWDMEFIEDDLSTRTRSDKLFDMLFSNLQKGESSFEVVGAEINIVNGNYSFKDALMASGLVTIDVNGQGNLKSWNTNTTFKATFERLRDKIVPIEFKWSGQIDNPRLVVDGSSLINKYNAYWEQVAKQKRKEEEARIKALNTKMATTQKRVSEVKTLIDNEILPRIEKYKPLSSNSDIKNQYNSHQMLVVDINNQLEMMQEKQRKTFTDDDIMQMDARLESFMPQLEKMPQQLDETFAYDLKIHSGAEYNNVINIYDNAQTKAVNYQQALNSYVLRLLQLNSLIVLDRDPHVTDHKSHIEDSLRKLEDLHKEANDLRQQIEKAEELNELDKLYRAMKVISEKSNAELNVLNTNMEELFDYAQKLVRAEEGANSAHEDEQNSAESEEENIDDIEANIEETDADTPLVETKPEPAAEPQKPLLREIIENQTEENSENQVSESANIQNKPIVSYRSKLAPSGVITRGKQVMEVKQNKLGEQNSSAPLLKPLTEDKPLSGGTIKTKY